MVCKLTPLSYKVSLNLFDTEDPALLNNIPSAFPCHCLTSSSPVPPSQYWWPSIRISNTDLSTSTCLATTWPSLATWPFLASHLLFCTLERLIGWQYSRITAQGQRWLGGKIELSKFLMTEIYSDFCFSQI